MRQNSEYLAKLRCDAASVFRSALQTANPESCVSAALAKEPLLASIGSATPTIIAVGKASVPMARAAEAVFPLAPGIIVTPTNYKASPITRLQVITEEHPIPSAFRAGQAISDTVENAKSPILLLISGGASALSALPAAGIHKQTLVDSYRTLVRSAAPIHVINGIRKHLEALKGGKLAQRTSQPIIALILSDAIGDNPSDIGSGLVAADPTTFADCAKWISEYQLELPSEALTWLHSAPAHAETRSTCPDNATNLIIGSNAHSLVSAQKKAASLGYKVHVLGNDLAGDTSTVAAMYETHLRGAGQEMLLAGGEPTVQVRGSGRGGRNQHLALQIVERTPHNPTPFAFLAAGSDGIDGNTNAAGAIIDSTSRARLDAKGLCPSHYLENNDAYPALLAVGDLLFTGPTFTNVMDFHVLCR